MTPEVVLHTHLLADPSVAGIVGTRIYPKELPQTATLPALSYHVVFARGTYSYTGPSTLVRARVQMDAWANTYAQAVSLTEAVRRALVPFSNETVQGAFCTSTFDVPEPVPNVHHRAADYLVCFNQPITQEE